MSKAPLKANFKSFTAKAKESRDPQKEEFAHLSLQIPSYRYLQVRVTKEDAQRLKAVLSSKGLSVQSVLVDALNLWMSGHRHPPISDPGTSREKSNS